MRKNLTSLGLLFVFVFGAALTAHADERTEVIVEPCECLRATSIDFAATFGLNSEAVRSLGTRIDAANRDPDPVGLAMAARELQALESATGKEAEVTSTHLFEHAAKLAEMRYEALELKAVAALMEDGAARDQLIKAATLSQKHAKEREAKARDGELERGITHNLYVNNHSHQHISVYYNGRLRGEVGPHSHSQFHICDWTGCPRHDHWEVEGRGCDGGYWRYVGHGRVSDKTLCFNSSGHIH